MIRRVDQLFFFFLRFKKIRIFYFCEMMTHLWAKCHLDSICKFFHSLQHESSCIGAKLEVFWSCESPLSNPVIL